jgi:hypothetical protein
MKPGFRLMPNGDVIDARAFDVICIGYVTRLGKGDHWIGLDVDGFALAGPTRHRDLAALTVVRNLYPSATLRSLA